MLKDITLGQYFPGNTVIHNLDPRTKLLMTLVFIAALFTADSFLSFGIIAAYLGMVVAISGVGFKTLLKGLKPLLLILTMTGLLNLFLTPGELLFSRQAAITWPGILGGVTSVLTGIFLFVLGAKLRVWRKVVRRLGVLLWLLGLLALFFGPGEPILLLGQLVVTREGLSRAMMLVLRIAMMVMGTFLMTYTTAPMALTDALEALLGPLKRIRLPVHELAMIMSTALRFIPTLIEETDRIMSAQKARGANFETGSIFQRAKAMLPILVPLFMSAFRRADELAVAMESRCYHGGEGRTRMRKLVFARRDILTGLVGALLLAVIIGLTVAGL